MSAAARFREVSGLLVLDGSFRCDPCELPVPIPNLVHSKIDEYVLALNFLRKAIADAQAGTI